MGAESDSVFPHFLWTGRQPLCPVTGNGTRWPSGQLGAQRRRRGRPARQVPGKSRHRSCSNQVMEERLMRICWQRCEQMDGNQKHSGTGHSGEPAPPAGLEDSGRGPRPLGRADTLLTPRRMQPACNREGGASGTAPLPPPFFLLPPTWSFHRRTPARNWGSGSPQSRSTQGSLPGQGKGR